MPRPAEERLLSILPLAAGVTLSAVLSGIGCAAPDVLIVPEGTPVQLAEPIEARVFIVQSDGTRVLSKTKVTLPAGWWVASVPETSETESRPDASDTR
jgi:hypothetical protein